MIPVTSRKDQHIAVFGLGSSGLAAARALSAGGASVIAWDDGDLPDRDAGAEIEFAEIKLQDFSQGTWPAVDALVLAPGVPLTHPAPHPVVLRAQDAGCPVIGDIELLSEVTGTAAMVGITGTNGKSTTTALIGHILQSAGRAVSVGGNIGEPALALAPPNDAPNKTTDDAGIFVLELSSFQLDLTRHAAFDVAVWLNIGADHLDRHGDLDGYVSAKKNIFRKGQRGRNGHQCAIIGVDDPCSRAVFDDLARDSGWTVIPISVSAALPGSISVIDGVLRDAAGDGDDVSMDLSGHAHLPGSHNWQNAAAAWGACRALGVPASDIRRGIESFGGLAHRHELVRRIAGVGYINDSKATNADAAARAIDCYDHVYWIAGGRAKGSGFTALDPVLSHIKHAYLIGEAADEIAGFLAGRVPASISGDLETALTAAHAAAQQDAKATGADAAVLLSPACASFDQYSGFAARGDAFRKMVMALGTGGAS